MSQNLGKTILTLVGGENNITHCATRLRMRLANKYAK